MLLRTIRKLCLGWAMAALATGAAAAPAPVVLIPVNGAIGPASADFIERSLERASKMQAQLAVIELDTPGGLDPSMRQIIKAILASPVPVATFVAPAGARAASAGTYILYASHLDIGGEPSPSRPDSDTAGSTANDQQTNADGKANSAPAPRAQSPVRRGVAPPTSEPTPPSIDLPSDGRSTATRKQVQDAAAYIRSLAQMHGRNGDWAERSVREAVSLSATDALSHHVIDVIAGDLDTLLAKLDARRIDTAQGVRTLDTAHVPVVRLEPDWRTRLLAVITDPNVALILMMIGMYGLFFEFSNPGFVLPGVAGAISLLVGLFALQMLPVNYAGLILVLLGIAFLIAEAFLPTFGSLGFGGIIAFGIGALMLIDTDVPGFGIPVPLIVGLALLSAAFFITVSSIALNVRRRPVAAGAETMIGSIGVMLGELAAPSDGSGKNSGETTGWARVHSEQWRVHSDRALPRGTRVRCRTGGGAARTRRTSVMSFTFGFTGFIVLIVATIVVASIRIFREYERGVVFMLGRFWRVKGPGLVLIIPGIQQVVRIDLRTIVLDVPSQDLITHDNVSVKVNAVVYFRVVDPEKAVIQVARYLEATSQLAQTTLRSVLGKHELDALLAEREKLNDDIQKVLDTQTDAWGIKVSNVEIKHVDLNESMVRAIARQAEAERERRAKIIHAEGELQASEKLLQAARMLARQPQAMQLRYLQTLTSVAGDKTSTIVFPVPMDVLGALTAREREADGG
ncbi:hypothetical protein DFQ30_005597 [Apophysomyces sp. BC1015]|nr:hypothetical protein DFQ30_005597 [Apophysomyces sp. BC1015]